MILVYLACFALMGASAVVECAKTPGVSYFRFAHFMGRNDKSLKVNVTFPSPDNRTVTVKASEVTDYFEIQGNKTNLTFTIVGSTKISHEFVSNYSCNRRTIFFTWSNGLVINWLEDIMDPVAAFSEMSKKYNSTKPYHNNTLIRFVIIDPQNRNLSFLVKQELTDETYYQKLEESKYKGYYLDSSYAPKTFKIKSSAQSGSSSSNQETEQEFKEFLDKEELGLHGIYTVFWYVDSGDSIGDSSYKIVADYKPSGKTLPLIFLVVYIVTWGVFRTRFKILEVQRAKKSYYLTKTIRVPSAIESEQMITADYVSYIDTFRGLAVILFIFMKTGGGNFSFFNESLWDGMTLGDMPKFMVSWIMGFCIPLNINKKVDVRRSTVMKQVLVKAAIVFALGSLVSPRIRLQQEQVL